MTPSVCIASLLLATNVTCSSEFPDRCSQPIKRGEVSKLNGQVLSTELAVTLGQKAASAPLRQRLAVRTATTALGLRLGLEIRKAKIDLETERAKRVLLQSAYAEAREELDKARSQVERRWYEHPGIWVTVGAAMAIGTAAALDQTLGRGR